MPSTIGTPMSGWLCLLVSALFLSVFGLPVAGSFGSFSHTNVPQSAPPQLVMRTWLSLSLVYHVPSGSAASAGLRIGLVNCDPLQNAIIASQSANAALR